jgi:hypothetical protein
MVKRRLPAGQHPLIVGGSRPDDAEPVTGLDVPFDMLDILVSKGNTTGEYENAIAAQIIKMLIVNDLKTSTVLY